MCIYITFNFIPEVVKFLRHIFSAETIHNFPCGFISLPCVTTFVSNVFISVNSSKKDFAFL